MVILYMEGRMSRQITIYPPTPIPEDGRARGPPSRMARQITIYPPTPIPGEGTSLDQRAAINDGIVQVDLLVLLHRLLDQLDHRLLYGPLSLPKCNIYRLDPQTGDTARF